MCVYSVYIVYMKIIHEATQNKLNFKLFFEEQSEKICVLMRGLPGSGKSYATNQIMKEFGGLDRSKHIFTSDEYWLQNLPPNATPKETLAEYRKNWSPETVRLAHIWNQGRAREAIDRGVSPVILDSVHSQPSHMKEFAKYAKEAGYKILVREPTSPWWRAFAPFLRNKEGNKDKLDQFAKFLAGRNEHGVPEETLQRMIANWKPDVTPDDIFAEPPPPAPKVGLPPSRTPEEQSRIDRLRQLMKQKSDK